MIELHPITPDPAVLKQAYGCFPSGVTAVCAYRDGGPVGIAASSFTSVSIDPPLVSLCVQRTSTTWPRLSNGPRLGVSMLGETHDAACRQISSRTGDRFASIEWERTAEGAVLLRDAAAWLDCSVDTVVPAGDHELILLRVHALQVRTDVAPLVFHGSRFRQLAA
ncbi:flavin reductase family protein [Saccharopolyspora sp. K220]|uniref:flavin reductase family protein n=1 Tax=Saccharopolyspora soli TaxID=2926618 RepID=UPI001F569B66|nr:flavin reductase family protein [Saccharopolyspora soli]MCI2422627.1 flavin reductase family protein [Saccharopolyspora soli]